MHCLCRSLGPGASRLQGCGALLQSLGAGGPAGLPSFESSLSRGKGICSHGLRDNHRKPGVTDKQDLRQGGQPTGWLVSKKGPVLPDAQIRVWAPHGNFAGLFSRHQRGYPWPCWQPTPRASSATPARETRKAQNLTVTLDSEFLGYLSQNRCLLSSDQRNNNNNSQAEGLTWRGIDTGCPRVLFTKWLIPTTCAGSGAGTTTCVS